MIIITVLPHNASIRTRILGGGDFQIVEEDHEYNDITSYTEEPQ